MFRNNVTIIQHRREGGLIFSVHSRRRIIEAVCVSLQIPQFFQSEMKSLCSYKILQDRARASQ